MNRTWNDTILAYSDKYKPYLYVPNIIRLGNCPPCQKYQWGIVRPDGQLPILEWGIVIPSIFSGMGKCPYGEMSGPRLVRENVLTA